MKQNVKQSEWICLNVFHLAQSKQKHMCPGQRWEKFLTSRAFTTENILKILNWS